MARLLPVEKNSNQSDLLHDEQLAQKATNETSIPNLDSLTLASWLFLIGSLLFNIDSTLEIIQSVTLPAILHFSASLLFTIGSVCFIPKGQ